MATNAHVSPSAAAVIFGKGGDRHGFDWQILRRMMTSAAQYPVKLGIVSLTTFIRAFQRPLVFWALAAIIQWPNCSP